MTSREVAQARRKAKRDTPCRGWTQRFSDEDLLNMLRACAIDLGRTPGAKAFNKWCGRPRAQLLIMRFGYWAEACRLVDLEPNVRQLHIGKPTYYEEDYIKAYQRIRPFCPRWITVEEWQRYSVPGEPKECTIRHRFGSWSNFLYEMEEQ